MGSIIETKPGGYIRFALQENPTFTFKEHRPIRTKAQNDTLRGIERFIAWTMDGEKPTDDDCQEIHEAIIQAVMPLVTNKYNGCQYHKRTEDATITELARCIEYGLNWLACTDIPDEVVVSIGKSMKDTWASWYKWRYEQALDPLFEYENEMDWDTYRENHPVCELCGIGHSDIDPLERQHIVSGGSNIAAYEYPWNWLHSHHSHHANQHQEGWEPLLKEFPHIVGKVERAQKLAASVQNMKGENDGAEIQASNDNHETSNQGPDIGRNPEDW